ncbi:MAG: hypothetical protein JWO43_363 [Candidatus Adlerbacteria bacterium]|nr:hypothetical protein [Candidatus Adlerbacteria bacterium]
MEYDSNPTTDKRLPPGHRNFSGIKPADETVWIRKDFQKIFIDLQECLKRFLAVHPEWFYGTYSKHDDDLYVWHIAYHPAYRRLRGGWAANFEISFWKNGRTPLQKGVALKDSELDVLSVFWSKFFTAHPGYRCESERAEPWAITYNIFAKDD